MQQRLLSLLSLQGRLPTLCNSCIALWFKTGLLSFKPEVSLQPFAGPLLSNLILLKQLIPPFLLALLLLNLLLLLLLLLIIIIVVVVVVTLYQSIISSNTSTCSGSHRCLRTLTFSHFLSGPWLAGCWCREHGAIGWCRPPSPQSAPHGVMQQPNPAHPIASHARVHRRWATSQTAPCCCATSSSR